MELKEFIEVTLIQIVDGIVAAQEDVASKGAEVVPKEATFRTDQGASMWDGMDGTPIEQIEFDVAVTTTQGASTKGGIGIMVGAIGLGSQGQSDTSNQSLSRIKFKVPVKFPKKAG